jgi:pyruvate/2-oxoglutarate dehydrogenase complex dihydrolipoamide acyltransferase (E2) component
MSLLAKKSNKSGAASLSAQLLMRKGEAKPSIPHPLSGVQSLEQFEQDVMQRLSAPPSALPPRAEASPAAPEPVAAADDAAPAPIPLSSNRVRKAAFTLRLDADRHLKLRLLSAHSGRSSQQLVVAALDQFLKDQLANVVSGACACRATAQG